MNNKINKRLLQNQLNLSVLYELYTKFTIQQDQGSLDSLIKHIQDMDKGYSALKGDVKQHVLSLIKDDQEGIDAGAIETEEGWQLQ